MIILTATHANICNEANIILMNVNVVLSYIDKAVSKSFISNVSYTEAISINKLSEKISTSESREHYVTKENASLPEILIQR